MEEKNTFISNELGIFNQFLSLTLFALNENERYFTLHADPSDDISFLYTLGYENVDSDIATSWNKYDAVSAVSVNVIHHKQKNVLSINFIY